MLIYEIPVFKGGDFLWNIQAFASEQYSFYANAFFLFPYTGIM